MPQSGKRDNSLIHPCAIVKEGEVLAVLSSFNNQYEADDKSPE